VIERHLAAFPGSSRAELARWWGVAPGDLRAPITGLRDRLTEIGVEGTTTLARTVDLDALAGAEPATGIRLLGGFDPYTLSLQKEAEPLLPLARRPLVSREAGWISAVILEGGRVVGTWTHETGPKRVTLDVAPWRRLTRDERRTVGDEAERIASFLVPGAGAVVRVADPR
jgi:hypothetical protein